MALLKRKTRKAIRKIIKKAINKHGPVVVRHLATALAAGVATYVGADGDKTQKKLKKAVKNIPGGKKVLKAVSSMVPFVSEDAKDEKSHNGHKTDEEER